MRRSHLQLPFRLRWAFYASFAALFASGAAGWMVQRATTGDDFSSLSRAALPWLLKIHGGAAMVALFVLGVLYPLHIARGWRLNRNRFWGAVLVLATALLIVTGYLLYYASAEGLREIVSSTHSWIGLAFPLIVAWHIVRGRSSR